MADQVVVVSLVIKDDEYDDAVNRVRYRVNEWFNDKATRSFVDDSFLNGSLLSYSILDKEFDTVIIQGTEFNRGNIHNPTS